MVPVWFNLMDIGCFLATILFAVSGFQKGFAKQVSHDVSFLFFGAVLFLVYPVLFDYFAKLYYNMNPLTLMWIILIVSILLAIGVFLLTHKLMVKYLKTKIAVWLDKSIGFILGLFRGAALALLIMIIMAMVGTRNVYNSINANSVIGEWVCEDLIPIIQPEIKRVSLEAKVNKLRDRLLERKEPDMSE